MLALKKGFFLPRPSVGFFFMVVCLFLIRLAYGLCSEFWFEDELQIYLIGLKSFATHTWPYYGPDVVYTKTQIPGALQGILVSFGLYIYSIPEMPFVILNLLSFGSLSFFCIYASKRLNNLPTWFTWCWVMTLPWALFYSTRITNPSYALVFSIPFFIMSLEALKIFDNQIFSKNLSLFIMGLCFTCTMQLHLSFVLMAPILVLSLVVGFNSIKKSLKNLIFLLSGLFIGGLTIIPTLLLSSSPSSATSNVHLNLSNIKNVITILIRYLSLVSFQIPHVLGENSKVRFEVIKSYPWIAPFALILLVIGFLQIAFFLYGFANFKNKAWDKFKLFNLILYIILFMSFFFSVKGPSSHTFYILLPIPLLFSLYCYDYVWNLSHRVQKGFYLLLISNLIFHVGLGLYNFNHKSLYMDRPRVQNAINKRDYKIVGPRRPDLWQNGGY